LRFGGLSVTISVIKSKDAVDAAELREEIQIWKVELSGKFPS
jgi:hypothetical protein